MLEHAFEQARSKVVVIDLVAEPGLGKSRLLHEFRQRIGNQGAFVLAGSCSPDGQQTPFLPFIEVVRHSFRISPGEAEKDIAQKLEMGLTALGLHSPRNAGLLLHLLGLRVPDDVLAGLDGVLIGLRTRELMQQLLEARSRLSPVVMMIEDLHWIDSVSEELLGKISGSEAKLRLLILTTRRPEYAPPWLDRASVTKLPLEPLPTGDIRHLVQARLGVDALPDAFARQLTEKAEGNPLFAEELVSFLTERGVLRTAEGTLNFDASAVAMALPASVQSVLIERVDRLAPDDRALLQAASVIGRRFDSDLVAVVVDETDIDLRLTAMQALDLVRREGNSSDYVFKHALVRDALYQSLLSEARTPLHLKIAEETERRSGNRLTEVAEALAHHYSQTGQAEKAFTYLSMAGSKSLSVYSLDEATTHFEAALALIDKSPSCASDDQVGDFLVSYMLLLNMSGQPKVMIDVLQHYLPRVDSLGDDPRVVVIRHHGVVALLFNARYQEAAALQRETLPMGARLGGSKSKAYSLAGEIFVSTLVAPKSLNEFEALNKEAIKAASDTTDAYIQNVIRWNIGWGQIHRGRMTQAREQARELMRLGRLLNDPRSTGLGLGLLTWIAAASDAYADALEYSEQALAVAVTPLDRATAIAGKACALVLLRQIEEATPLVEEQRRLCLAHGLLYNLVSTDAMLGLCRVMQGNIGGGIKTIEDAILMRDKEGYRTAADWYRLYLCEVYLQVIDGSERLPLITLLLNLPVLLKAMIMASSHITALVSHVLQNPHFDPAGHFIGRAQMMLGLLYKTKRKRGLAAQHLTEAQQIFSQFGQTPILGRVETALSELDRWR